MKAQFFFLIILDYPVAASFPHFLYGDEKIKESVEGLNPDESKHSSFAMVEPVKTKL